MLLYLLLQLTSQGSWVGDGPSPGNDKAHHRTLCIACNTCRNVSCTM